MVVSGLPISRDWDGNGGRPSAAMRGSVFRSGVGAAGDVVFLPNRNMPGADAGECGREFWSGAGNVKGDALAGLIAAPARIAFDRGRAKRDWYKENGEENGDLFAELILWKFGNHAGTLLRLL